MLGIFGNGDWLRGEPYIRKKIFARHFFQAALAGGNVRVGREDNLYNGPGQLATNEQLVARAKLLLETMGAKVMSPQAVRDQLKLVKR